MTPSTIGAFNAHGVQSLVDTVKIKITGAKATLSFFVFQITWY